MSPARLAAFSVLQRVENGGYAVDLLVTQTAGLSSRDAGLATEIVLGSLRRQSQLDWIIQESSRRDVRSLDAPVRVALRIGIYQLRHLDRVPPHAAVSESVDLVRKAKLPSAAGLVNAVLRRVPPGDVAWPDRARALATPHWLLVRWERQFGREAAEAAARAFLERPEAYVRVPPTASVPEGAELAPTDVPGCFRLLAGDPSPLRRQDISSQTIVPLLDLQPGNLLLDLCAAPGNKTAQALETPIRAIAGDLYHQRLATVPGPNRVVLDGTQSLPFRHTFDRILIDAPCCGTGTLARNPEIKWRIQPHDLAEFAMRQRALLENALGQLAPGGRLVYSTCSLERDENEAVVADVLASQPAFHVVAEHRRLPGRDAGDGFYAVVITWRQSVNG